MEIRKKATLTQLTKYLKSINSPWLSLHIDLLPWYIFLLSKHLGLNLSPPDPKQAVRQFIEMLEEIKKVIAIPIILENLHSLQFEKYDYAANPKYITEIVNKTDSGFLLDIAHARIAATFQKQDLSSYIERLPLEKIEQIHVSGIRVKNGHIYDAHESLEDEDYQILKWILGISKPQIVTLEYFRKKELLREQILRLKEIVTGYSHFVQTHLSAWG